MRDILFTVAISVALFLVGCATLQQHQAGAKLAIQYATIRYVSDDLDKRDRVLKIATQTRELAASAATLETLEAAVRGLVEWDKLKPEDRLLASSLLDLIGEELRARFDNDLLDPEQLVALDQVLRWIEEAATI